MTEARPSDTQNTIRRALNEIRDLKARLARAERDRHEPLAIVGMGLRLPGGVKDAAGFENLLWSGRDGIMPIPKDRWEIDDFYNEDPDAAGSMTTRYGGFIEDVDMFDAEFFGIAPEEARHLDPQQRLVLEVAWEALENAGIAATDLRGSRTGVYLGIANVDYGRTAFSDRSSVGPYHGTGTAQSVAAGRISYILGLRGPAISIDTACSSSLVSLHLAAQALRNGECDLALAGGVNLILTPDLNIAFSRGRMMSADGHCKTFDASADGYVRSEGCGMIVLRRLSDALESQDPLLAVMRGSAINQDGHSAGLTAPNGAAQEDLIKAALKDAGLEGRDLDFVETHGTGTPLGDPIEVRALIASCCHERPPEQPLLLGAAKTVVGHLEAAAGITGVAKAVIALRRRELPANLNFSTGNPEIDWSSPVAVPITHTPLHSEKGLLRAGVSSFGFSGTNAHVILEEADVPAPVESATTHLVLPLSARHPQALRDLAGAYATGFETDQAAKDLCRTAALGRSHLQHRLAVTAESAEGLRSGIRDFLADRPNEACHTSKLGKARKPRIAFLFSGQGGHYQSMARELLATSPVFRRSFETADAALRDMIEVPLIEALNSNAGNILERTEIVQPAMVAVQCALSDLWRALGILPSTVLGHSLGEFAAAYAAGVMTLKDAVRAAAIRGRLLASLPKGGSMASVSAAPEVIEAALKQYDGRISIAAYNSAQSVTLSGPEALLSQCLDAISDKGARTRKLNVPFAAHSAFVEPVCDEMRSSMEHVDLRNARVPIISTVTGKFLQAESMAEASYWSENLRQPVRFAEAMEALVDSGTTHAIEIGPHPMLLSLAEECATDSAISLLPSLQRDRRDWCEMANSLSQLFVDDAEINWRGYLENSKAGGRRVAAPTYPFQRKQFALSTKGPEPRSYWETVSVALSLQAERGPLDLDISSYDAKWAHMNRITTAVAQKTLHDAGVFSVSGSKLTFDEIMAALGANEMYRHLIGRWLERLCAQGVLQLYNGEYVATAPLAAPDMKVLWEEAQGLFADNTALLNYVRHCAGLAPAVISGRCSPLETLFPDGTFELAQALYEESAMMRYINGLARSAVASMAGMQGVDQALEVLEIGAGTGGTSSSILSALPQGTARYVYTDVSDAFLDRGRERFGDRSDVVFRKFDMENSLESQGFQTASLDLVIAANVVHAGSDLPEILERLRSLLRPGALLMLVESTEHLDWFDITTGLIEGWQKFDDGLRIDNPLMRPEIWCRALEDAGFVEALAWPEAGSAASVLGQHVILARQAGKTRPPQAKTAVTENVSSTPEQARTGFAKLFAEATDRERLEMIRDQVRRTVIRVLGRESNDAPGRRERLMDLGMDSLMAMRIRKLLTEALELSHPLPASIAFDHPSIEAISTFILERMTGKDVDDVIASRNPVPQVSDAPDITDMTDEEVEALLLERVSPK